ncbi:MAG: hypothetical protein AAB268_13010 [Elusimicrobiota bacterium]
MTDRVRQEFNDVKAAGAALGVQMTAMRTEFGVMKQDISTLKTDVVALKTDVAELKTLARNTAVVVSGHTETLGLISQQLRKLNELDGIKKCLEAFTSEIIASRHERALAGKSFIDQQATLTDHELRLTRLELRGNQS